MSGSGAVPPVLSSVNGFKIYLNVYDVTNAQSESTNAMVVRLNNVTHQLGVGGVFHGAIEVEEFGLEWSFGYCDQGTGVYCCKAQQNTMYTMRQQIDLGYSPKTKNEFKMILHKLQREWAGQSYELLTRNCCHFCDALALALECKSPPAWLNRLAYGADATVAFTNDAMAMARNVGKNIMWLLGRPEEGAPKQESSSHATTSAAANPNRSSEPSRSTRDCMAEAAAQSKRMASQSGFANKAVGDAHADEQLKTMSDVGLRFTRLAYQPSFNTSLTSGSAACIPDISLIDLEDGSSERSTAPSYRTLQVPEQRTLDRSLDVSHRLPPEAYSLNSPSPALHQPLPPSSESGSSILAEACVAAACILQNGCTEEVVGALTHSKLHRSEECLDQINPSGTGGGVASNAGDDDDDDDGDGDGDGNEEGGDAEVRLGPETRTAEAAAPTGHETEVSLLGDLDDDGFMGKPNAGSKPSAPLWDSLI